MHILVQASKFRIGEVKYLVNSEEHNEMMKIRLLFFKVKETPFNVNNTPI